MSLSAGFFNMPGGPEWIVIFVAILIIFGPKSLPKIGHAIGRGIREFKDASDGITKAIEEETSALDRESQTSRMDSISPEAEATSPPPEHEAPAHHTD